MDPEIWGQTTDRASGSHPHIPSLKSFLSLTSTCRHFHSLLSSHAFASGSNRLTTSTSAFLVLSYPHSHRHHFPLYNSLLGSWRLSLLPSSSSPSLILSTSNSFSFSFSLPSSSAFFVSNLLTCSSRLVPFPSLPFSPYSFELLSFVSSPSSGYCILVLSSHSSPTFLYDSRSLSWRRFDSFNLKLTGSSLREGVYVGGKFNFATSNRFPITQFDPESGCVDRDREQVRAFRKLMSVCYHNYEHVYCLWHQGMICICCYTWSEVLYYRESRRTWHWLPKCPYLPETWSCGFRWCSFLPEISACV